MYQKYITCLKDYISNREDLRVARHVFVYRKKAVELSVVIEHYLNLTETDRLTILAEYS